MKELSYAELMEKVESLQRVESELAYVSARLGELERKVADLEASQKVVNHYHVNVPNRYTYTTTTGGTTTWGSPLQPIP